MSNPGDQTSKMSAASPPPPQDSVPTPTAPAGGDEENQAPGGARLGISGILSRWRREDLLNKGSLALRAIGLLFSLLAFLIMASNKHGDWKDFDKYAEYKYVLAIAILSTLYTGFQVLRQAREFSGVSPSFDRQNMALIDFFGDQIIAYLLISAASAAVPLTNNMREGADNIFTDASAASISMEFLAFFSLALSALISGYKLSNRSYI